MAPHTYQPQYSTNGQPPQKHQQGHQQNGSPMMTRSQKPKVSKSTHNTPRDSKPLPASRREPGMCWWRCWWSSWFTYTPHGEWLGCHRFVIYDCLKYSQLIQYMPLHITLHITARVKFNSSFVQVTHLLCTTHSKLHNYSYMYVMWLHDSDWFTVWILMTIICYIAEPMWIGDHKTVIH